MPWEIWVIAGIILLASEAVVPLDFFLFFIGLSCVLTGMLVATDLVQTASLEWMIAAVFAIVFVFGLRPRIRSFFMKNQKQVSGGIAQDEVVPLSDISPGQEARGEARGTSWNVKNMTDTVLRAGERYRVARCEGITLIVE